MNRDRNHRHSGPLLAVILLVGTVLAACGSTGGAARKDVWLDNVQMINATDGWALLQTSKPGGQAPLQPARTSDGGRTWTTVTPGPATSLLPGGQVLLDATRPDQAWFAVAGSGGTTTEVFGTSDGGRSWHQSAAIAGSQPVALDFPGPADGWLLESLGTAMGQNPVRLFRSTDGGQQWAGEARSAMGSQPEAGGLSAGCDKSGLAFSTGQAGHAAPQGFITSFCNSLGGAVLRSADGGVAWAPATLPVPQRACDSGGCDVPAPQFAGSTTFLQIEDPASPAYLLVSTDSGGSWTVRRLPAGAGPFPRLQFFSPADGIAVAASSQQAVGSHTYLTGDGGRTWTAVPLSRPFGQVGASFDFVSPRTGFAWIPATGTRGRTPAMYQTSNSGRIWTSFTPRLG